MAYSPLARGRLKKEPRLINLAKRLERCPAQVMLRWAIEKGLVVIPKTIRPQRLLENISIFDFSLEPKDVLVLDKLNQEHSVLKPPFNFDSGGYVIL
jgi:diketogulonate reductase-like aldo/keto reductase